MARQGPLSHPIFSQIPCAGSALGRVTMSSAQLLDPDRWSRDSRAFLGVSLLEPAPWELLSRWLSSGESPSLVPSSLASDSVVSASLV